MRWRAVLTSNKGSNRVAIGCTSAAFFVVVTVSTLVLDILFCFPKWIHWELTRPWLIRRRLRIHGWADPKTVSHKSKPMDSSSPGSHDPRTDTFRFAAFGTSKTWGSGLEDPDTQSYIKRLSPNAANFGLQSTGADHPSFCLQTMLGNHTNFDVIILEFAPLDLDDLERLVKRVRSRFPSTIIIFLTIFAPFVQFSYRGDMVITHLRHMKIDYNEVPIETAIQHLNATEFSFPAEQDYQQRMANCTKIVQSVGGHVLEFPPIHNHIKRYISENAKYYGNTRNPLDFVHPSVLGHQTIADLIRSIISDIVLPHGSDISGGSSGSSVLGNTKLTNDRCTTYYTYGDLSSLHHVVRNMKGLKLVNMRETFAGDKWALEVERTGAEFNVVCMFPNCGIYVTYMIQGPKKSYPKVRFSIIDNQEPILVDPYTPMYHIRKIVFLTTVKEAGEVTVRVTPLPEDESSPLLFRIASVITYQQST